MNINIRNRNCRGSKTADKRYGDWFIRNDITEYSLSEDQSGYDDLSVSFEPEDGDELFLVRGVYSSGDSFGDETGKVFYIDIFKTYDEALLLKEKVELFNEFVTKDWYGTKPKEKADMIRGYEFKLKGHLIENKEWLGKYFFSYNEKEHHFPWGGYFEKLSGVEIVQLRFSKEEN